MEKQDLPYLPLWINDLMSDRKAICMTAEEFGSYMLLLISQWKDGPIDPEDMDGIGRCKVTRRVRRCFPKGVNAKLERVRAEALAVIEGRKDRARAAAGARWGNAEAMPEQCPGNAQALRKQSGSNAGAMLGDAIPRTRPRPRTKDLTPKAQNNTGSKGKSGKPTKAQRTKGIKLAGTFWDIGTLYKIFSWAGLEKPEDLFWLAWNCKGATGASEHGFSVVTTKLMELKASEKKGQKIDNPGGACVVALRDSGQKVNDKLYTSVCKVITEAKKTKGSK